MYFEELEAWTKRELSGHLSGLLAAEKARHADGLPLAFPVSIDTSSVVGGVIRLAHDTSPQYAIDCQQKEFVPQAGEDLPMWDYLGQFTIMVVADRADFADLICKRHAKVIETWISLHLYPGYRNEEFTIHEMRYSSTVFSGSLPLEQENGREGDTSEEWAAGAEINLAWRVVEPLPYQSHE